jgi:hypothetical protein
VTLYAYGQQTPVTAIGELRLPAGASTSGTVSVYPAAVGPSPGDIPQAGLGMAALHGSTDDRQTVAQRVAAVRALPTNDQLVVMFTPDLGPVTPASAGIADPTTPVQTTLTLAGSCVTGSIQRRTGQLRLRVSPASVPYAGAFVVSGALAATDGETTVDLFRVLAATGEKVKIATVAAAPDGRGGAAFSQRLDGWTSNAWIVAEWGGDASALGTSARAAVVVSQAVTLRAGKTSVPVGTAVKLSAAVLPGKAGQLVSFERRVGGSWTLLKAVKLGAGRTADLIWKPPLGASSVRARVAATAANGTGRSAAVTITATGR